MIEEAFGHWLAGFIDGEGSFTMIGGDWPTCRFSLVVRDDDAAVIEEIARCVGFGRVRRISKRPPDRPVIGWEVTAKADCLLLVALLDRFPLRAKKARDFRYWREAVLLWAQRTPRAGGESAADIGKRYGYSRGHIDNIVAGRWGYRLASPEAERQAARMLAIKDEMEAQRRYDLGVPT